MVIQTEMRFLDCRSYDKKDKKSGEKTGEKGNILQLVEVNEDGKVSIGTYFPSDDQIKTKDGVSSIKFLDKVQVTLDLENVTSKPRFVSLGDVMGIAHLVYSPIKEEIQKSIEADKATKKAS